MKYVLNCNSQPAAAVRLELMGLRKPQAQGTVDT